jgi:hypothetical protein
MRENVMKATEAQEIVRSIRDKISIQELMVAIYKSIKKRSEEGSTQAYLDLELQLHKFPQISSETEQEIISRLQQDGYKIRNATIVGFVIEWDLSTDATTAESDRPSQSPT